MIEPVQVLWSPAGTSMPSLGDRALVDVTDGDTPNIRMPIRMLSVDTPEVTARTPEGAAAVDEKFAQLAEWIDQGKAPAAKYQITDKNWTAAAWKEQPLSEYMTSDVSEDFPETVAAYIATPEALNARSPLRFKFVEDNKQSFLPALQQQPQAGGAGATTP